MVFSGLHSANFTNRYVKQLDVAQPPWLPGSEFSILDAELKAWRSGLPPSLEFTPETVYIRLESSQLGALTLLHCTYHNAMCDLYRVSMPELFKLKDYFSGEQPEYVKRLQYESLRHAQTMGHVLAGTAEQGPRFLADSMLASYAYNAARVMMYYIARLLDVDQPGAQGIVRETVKSVESCIEALRMMSMFGALAEPLVR